MDTHPATQPETPKPAPRIAGIKLLGVGHAGLCVLDHLLAHGLPAADMVALDSDPESLAAATVPEKLTLNLARGDRECVLAEEQLARVKAFCSGAKAVFVVSGLGGVTGTSASPLLASAARETGTLVLGFVTLPFTCEGSRRAEVARHGLNQLKAAADGVICLPNENASRLLDEHTSVLDTFKRSGELLADGVRGIWRLLAHKGLIEIRFDDLCDLVRARHTESAFAVAEAAGATRSREVLDKLLAHPMLDGGQVLAESDAVLVSLIAGPDLSMAEVNRVMEQLTAKCADAQVIMGASIDESFRERLAVTLIAARRAADAGEPAPARQTPAENIDTQLLKRDDAPRPESRIVPPPPSLTPDRMAQMFARQGSGGSRPRKGSLKMRQTQLPLEIVSKGRFDKSEPTIHKGEDLDVPTYIRRGVSLN